MTPFEAPIVPAPQPRSSPALENGQIAEIWLNEDWAGVLQQVGALPPHA